MANDQEVEITVTAKTQGVDEGFRKVDQGIDGLERQAVKAQSSFKDMFSVFTGSFLAGAALQGIRELGGALGSLPDLISRGSNIDDITTSFQNLSAQAGATGDALLNKFSAALGDTIPKVDLMKQANELLIGGLDPSSFELVAKAARAFGEATGTDASEGMNALTDSLLR
jgi:hypothetical protein